jgi:hypothetical protein
MYRPARGGSASASEARERFDGDRDVPRVGAAEADLRRQLLGGRRTAQQDLIDAGFEAIEADAPSFRGEALLRDRFPVVGGVADQQLNLERLLRAANGCVDRGRGRRGGSGFGSEHHQEQEQRHGGSPSWPVEARDRVRISG